MSKNFFEIGVDTGKQIEVRISYRIIQLFSEGLYSSPNKAVEELVSNSFDAGASMSKSSFPRTFVIQTQRSRSLTMEKEWMLMDSNNIGSSVKA